MGTIFGKYSFWALVFMLTMPEVPLSATPDFDTDSIVYVWDFKANPEAIRDIAMQLTSDFETELINLDYYVVLERRRYDRIISHRNLQEKISNMDEVPDSSKVRLQTQQAQVVIFGEVNDDINSGVYEVVVTFQRLNSEIVRRESILIGRGLIMDNETRKAKMKILLEKLHQKELNAVKREQFEWVSSILSSYIVRAKNVQKEFQDMASAAFEDERYFSQLNKTILDYNELFDDINDNHSKYQMSFAMNWEAQQVLQLENIFKKIQNDIHKSHMLKLDKVRIALWDYWQMSSRQKKKIKRREILNNVSETTRDLQTQIEITEIEINNFLATLQRGFNQH